MRGGFSIFVRKFRYCKGTKTTTDFTVMYWLQKDTCHWYGRTGHDAEVEVCKATPAEAGEKACYVISKIFILKDQNFSADSNYTKTKQKNLYILGLPYLFPFYPSRKKYQVKGCIKLVKTRECSYMPASSISCCHCRKRCIRFHMDNKHFLYLTLISSLSFFY